MEEQRPVEVPIYEDNPITYTLTGSRYTQKHTISISRNEMMNDGQKPRCFNMTNG